MGNAANYEATGKSDVSKPDLSKVQWPAAASAGGAAYANAPKGVRPSVGKDGDAGNNGKQ